MATLADLSDSYELPGHLSVDGSLLDSWPPFVVHTFDPREVNCTIRFDYTSNEMALFSRAQMTPGEEFLTDFRRGFLVDRLRLLDVNTLPTAIAWGNYSILEIFTETEANE